MRQHEAKMKMIDAQNSERERKYDEKHQQREQAAQKRHDEATASAKDAHKQQLDAVKDDHNRWNKLAWDEHRELRSESRMRFSRLEESTSRLEKMLLMLLMGMGFLSVLVLVFFLDYRRTWRTISTDIGQLRSMVETISTDNDRVAYACTTAYAMAKSGPGPEGEAVSPSIDVALNLVPERHAAVKQRALRCALQQVNPNVQ